MVDALCSQWGEEEEEVRSHRPRSELLGPSDCLELRQCSFYPAGGAGATSRSDVKSKHSRREVLSVESCSHSRGRTIDPL